MWWEGRCLGRMRRVTKGGIWVIWSMGREVARCSESHINVDYTNANCLLYKHEASDFHGSEDVSCKLWVVTLCSHVVTNIPEESTACIFKVH